MNDLLDAALGYAARGWPVFPCAPRSKAPAIAKSAGGNGVLDATTDPAQINAWWTAMPSTNIGIATGAPGPDVVDFDTDDPSGLAALTTLTQTGLMNGRGSMVRTRSGGWHIYFEGSSQRNSTLRSKTGPSVPVDFRGAGGYVVAPPSFVEADDKPAGYYVHVDPGAGPLAVIDWRIVRDLIIPPAPFQQPGHDPAAQPASHDLPGSDYAVRTSWPDILSPHGWRQVRQIGNVRYWCRPGKTGRFISASTRDDGGLWVFSTSTVFDAEQLYSKFGAYTVLAGFGRDHTAAAAQLRRDGFGAQEPAVTFTQPPQLPDAQDSSGEEWWSEIAARHTPINWQQLFDDTPDEEDWIAEPLLAAGRSIALYSPPKAGKSLLMLEIATALVSGRPVLGKPARKIRKVLYVDLENTRRDIRDRLTDLGYKPGDLDGLIYLSFPSLPMLDSAQGGREIMALAIAHTVDVVIIDTISRVISGKENDADTFAALYRYAMAPLKGLGIAVVRLDHAGKDLGKGQRGSSAKNADVDAVWTLNVAGPVITLQCEMSRTQMDVQALSLRRLADPLRHEVSVAAAAPVDKVQALMVKLDELGVPRDATNRQCQQALNRAAVGLNTNDLRAAVRTRKQQISLSVDLETNDLETAPANGLSQDQQTGETETGKTAGHPLTQDQQTGETTLPLGDKAGVCLNGSDPRRGQTRETGAGAGLLCHACGERHPPGPCFQATAAAS